MIDPLLFDSTCDGEADCWLETLLRVDSSGFGILSL